MKTQRHLDLDALCASFDANGYVVVPGMLDEGDVEALTVELEDIHAALVRGDLDRRHAGDIDTGDIFLGGSDGASHCRQVVAVTDVSPRARDALADPLLVKLLERVLGPAVWFWDVDAHGAVYCDARPGPGVTPTRTGWHSDHQARPHSSIWPGVAVTFHLDATSPANGFLRVVPGSHRWPTDGMPLGFERIPGEVALYCDRGDVLLHHCCLWHSAARATEDHPGGVRRHLRGAYLGGRRLPPATGVGPRVENAAR